jgi:hypothetical protein
LKEQVSVAIQVSQVCYCLGSSVESQFSAAIQVALGIGGAAFAAVLLIIGVYALLQKKRAEKAEEISKPFGNILQHNYFFWHLVLYARI